jgi:hypothetical protein
LKQQKLEETFINLKKEKMPEAINQEHVHVPLNVFFHPQLSFRKCGDEESQSILIVFLE